MKNEGIYLFGQGVSKHVSLISDKKIKYHRVLTIDDQYALVVFSFDADLQTDHTKETKVIQILKEQSLSLYELNVEDFYRYEGLFDNQTDKNVFFHCLHEHYRMNQMEAIIANHQYDKLGRLMKDSYNSYKYYYQSTIQKQDYLMILAEKHHTLGANIYENHLICLIESNKKQSFINKMKTSFKNTYGQPLKTEV